MNDSNGLIEKGIVHAGLVRWFAPVLIVVAICAIFWKTVCLQVPIYRLPMLRNIDVLFGWSASADLQQFAADPSSFLIQIPNGIYIERWFGKNVLPLWNPDSGLGEPFVGKINSYLFSPIRLLFPASNAYLYNLGIVSSVVSAGVGTYCLSRILGLSRWSGVLVAFGYALCPHFLHSVELPTQLCLYPWIIALFVWFRDKVTFPRLIVTGVLCGCLPYVMNPETILVAGGTGIICGVFPPSRKVTPSQILPFAKGVLLAMLVAISIAAPVLFPFIESMLDVYSYKFSDNWTNFYPWANYFCSLFYPLPEGPYIGALCPYLLPFGLLLAWRNMRIWLVLYLVLFVLATWLPPFDKILSIKPFYYIPANYYMPSLLLLTGIFVGHSFDNFLNRSFKYSNFWTATCLVLFGVVVSLSWSKITPQLSDPLAFLPIVSFVLTGIFLLVAQSIKIFTLGCVLRNLLAICFLVLNFASMVYSKSMELPNVEKFVYEENEITNFLQERGSRFMATGDRLFMPNSNLMYGLRDLRSFQPMHPSRFVNYIERLGARAFNLFFYDCPDKLNQLIDLASVKYIVSLTPVNSAQANDQDLFAFVRLEQQSLGTIVSDLELRSWDAKYDPRGQQILGKAVWHLQNDIPAARIQYSLLTNDGRKLWESRHQFLAKRQNDLAQTVSIPVPLSLPQATPIRVCVEIKNWDTPILPTGAALKLVATKVILAEFLSQLTDVVDSRHFRPVLETRGGIRIYENTKALDEAYLSSKVIKVSNGDRALATIASPVFDINTVVIEDGDFDLESISPRASVNPKAKVVWTNPNEVTIDCSPISSSILVFTQTYANGWEAHVDGQPTKILRANYLFQGVKLTPGKHIIKFEYRPISFYFGCALAGSSALALISICYLRWRSTRKKAIT